MPSATADRLEDQALVTESRKQVPPTPTIITPKSPKPSLPALKTPKSATLPSELPRSPHPGRLEVIKQEDDLKTPITPPTAYTDFLNLNKNLSPALSTPSTGRSPIFDRLSTAGQSTPLTQPSSAVSCTCSGHDIVKASSSAPIIPPSPFMRPPPSARSITTPLRRLRIPQSPAWSPTTDSPKSSAVFSPFSPADWSIDGKTRYINSPRSATHKSVSVRQVVTRTVTYTRTPLDPAPKGKKRRLNE